MHRYLRKGSVKPHLLTRGSIVKTGQTWMLVTSNCELSHTVIGRELCWPFRKKEVTRWDQLASEDGRLILFRGNPDIGSWRIFGGYRGGVFGHDYYASA